MSTDLGGGEGEVVGRIERIGNIIRSPRNVSIEFSAVLVERYQESRSHYVRCNGIEPFDTALAADAADHWLPIVRMGEGVVHPVFSA